MKINLNDFFIDDVFKKIDKSLKSSKLKKKKKNNDKECIQAFSKNNDIKTDDVYEFDYTGKTDPSNLVFDSYATMLKMFVGEKLVKDVYVGFIA